MTCFVTCACGPVVKTLGRHVQESVMRLVAGIRASARVHPHDGQTVNPGQERGFDGVLYKLTVADSLISSVMILAALR